MKKTATLVLATFWMFMVPSLAHAITVDGKMGDWGVSPDVYASSQWTPTAGIQSVVEDYDPATQNGGYLNPGYGGQLFDAEAMYATFDSTTFYYAVVTGQPPQGASGYKPGDIAFDFGSDGSYEYGIETTGNAGNTVGKLYPVLTWNYGLWDAIGNYNPSANYQPTDMASVGGALGTGSLYYGDALAADGSTLPGDHYVIEGSIPISALGYGKQFTMSWTETCGNDVIQLRSFTPTPEPASMVLFGIGLAGLGFIRRKQA